MFEYQKRVEIERRVLKAGDDRARAGLPLADPDSLRLIVAEELELELERKRLARPEPAREARPLVSPHRVGPAKPVARPLSAVKPPVPPYLAAERARVCAIIAAAPKGAEAARDEAIRCGDAVELFRYSLASQAILNATRIVRG